MCSLFPSDVPPLRVFCAPVSGGAMVSQLALMKELSIARSLFDPKPDNIRPHIFLGNSGGNICAYIGMAAQWSPYGIDRICTCLDPEMLTMNWWPKHLDFLPTSLIGIFTG